MIRLKQQTLLGEDLTTNRPPVLPANAKLRFWDRAGDAFAMTDRQLSTHTMLVGSSGCGKTSVIYSALDQLLPSLGKRDLLVIFDVGGEYARRYFDPQNPCHILAGCSGGQAVLQHSWNLFGELMGPDGHPAGNWRVTAGEIAKAIMYGYENQQQPFFSLAAEALIRDSLQDMMNEALAKRSVRDLYTGHWLRTMRSRTLSDWVALTEKEGFCSHRMFFGDSPKMNTQALGVFGEMNAALDNMFAVFDNTPGRGEFSMRELLQERNGQVVFLVYDIAIGESQKPLLRLWFDLALKFALSAPSQSSGCVYLVCDELALLPQLQYLSDALNFGRARGLRLICGLQSANQFRDSYGSQAESLLAGFGSCFAFRCNDSATREYIAERFGRQYSTMVFQTPDGKLDFQQREGHVAEDWLIRSLNTGEALIDLPADGGHPFRFYFREYQSPRQQDRAHPLATERS